MHMSRRQYVEDHKVLSDRAESLHGLLPCGSTKTDQDIKSCLLLCIDAVRAIVLRLARHEDVLVLLDRYVFSGGALVRLQELHPALAAGEHAACTEKSPRGRFSLTYSTSRHFLHSDLVMLEAFRDAPLLIAPDGLRGEYFVSVEAWKRRQVGDC